MSIPVICDHCRKVGFSGDGDFAHLGDLLDFTPVPRKTQRADGWTGERQRAFIAALSATGSKRQAARAIGMAAYGVDQMLKSEGNDSFKAAFDRAMAIAKANGSMKIAAGVADAAARNAQMAAPSRLRGYQPEPEPEIDHDEQWRLIEQLGLKFMKKVEAEREARLAGRIVEADFLLRQVTALEVAFDLTTAAFGWDAWAALQELQREGRNWAAIVETPFTRWLDKARRDYWAGQGDPPRPEHPRPGDIVEQGGSPWGTGEQGFSTAADKTSFGALTTPAEGYSQEQWAALSVDEQRPARNAECERAAEAQVQWETRARAEWEASTSSSQT